MDKLFLLVSNFLDLIFSYFQLLVKLSLLQLQQGLALPEHYKFLLVGALHVLKLLLVDFFLRVESILKSFQRIYNLSNPFSGQCSPSAAIALYRSHSMLARLLVHYRLLHQRQPLAATTTYAPCPVHDSTNRVVELHGCSYPRSNLFTTFFSQDFNQLLQFAILSP